MAHSVVMVVLTVVVVHLTGVRVVVRLPVEGVVALVHLLAQVVRFVKKKGTLLVAAGTGWMSLMVTTLYPQMLSPSLRTRWIPIGFRIQVLLVTSQVN
jgi:hypothetical protein